MDKRPDLVDSFVQTHYTGRGFHEPAWALGEPRTQPARVGSPISFYRLDSDLKRLFQTFPVGGWHRHLEGPLSPLAVMTGEENKEFVTNQGCTSR